MKYEIAKGVFFRRPHPAQCAAIVLNQAVVVAEVELCGIVLLTMMACETKRKNKQFANDGCTSLGGGGMSRRKMIYLVNYMNKTNI